MKGWTAVKCEICGDSLNKEFVDGKTRLGPWAKMCVSCHRTHGVGFGIGRGQKYNLETMKKIEG